MRKWWGPLEYYRGPDGWSSSIFLSKTVVESFGIITVCFIQVININRCSNVTHNHNKIH